MLIASMFDWTADEWYKLITAVGLIVTSLLAYLSNRKAGTVVVKQEDMHKAMNSRLDELVASARAASHAEGKAEGVAEGRTAQTSDLAASVAVEGKRLDDAEARKPARAVDEPPKRATTLMPEDDPGPTTESKP